MRGNVGNVSNHNGGCGCPSCLGSGEGSNTTQQTVTTRGEQLSGYYDAPIFPNHFSIGSIGSGAYWTEFGDTTSAPGFTIVTYTFSTTNKYWTNDGATDLAKMSADQIKASMLAMREIEKVANIRFVEAANPNAANIKLMQADLPTGVVGMAHYPNKIESDVLIDKDYSSRLQPGTLGFAAILHELGHAIGLSHPNGSGTTSSYSNDQTIMSYNAGKYTGIFTTYAPTTMQPLDIEALQNVYGANTTTATSANAYMLNGSTKVQTIWDAGGTDRIDASTSKYAATIDLRDGIAPIGASADYVSYSGGSRFFIAGGTVIEHANGSNYSDKITGNSYYNSIVGNKGNDTIDGYEGNDYLNGGSGNDYIMGGDGSDSVIGESGADTLAGNNGSDSIAGGAGKDVFLFNIAPDSTPTASDIIVDFTKGQDIINIDTVVNKSGVNFTAITSGSASGTILGYTISGNTTTITSADNSFQVILATAVNLTNADFIF